MGANPEDNFLATKALSPFHFLDIFSRVQKNTCHCGQVMFEPGSERQTSVLIWTKTMCPFKTSIHVSIVTFAGSSDPDQD